MTCTHEKCLVSFISFFFNMAVQESYGQGSLSVFHLQGHWKDLGSDNWVRWTGEGILFFIFSTRGGTWMGN